MWGCMDVNYQKLVPPHVYSNIRYITYPHYSPDYRPNLINQISFSQDLIIKILISARNLVCFSQPEGDETKDCDQSRGFKTCFTRYNSGGF